MADDPGAVGALLDRHHLPDGRDGGHCSICGVAVALDGHEARHDPAPEEAGDARDWLNEHATAGSRHDGPVSR
jgi:hypothetical protein